METAEKAINDLWMLSTSAGVLCYIFAATVLTYILNFDPAISDNEKAGILTISFALSIVLAYNYRHALKKFKAYKSIFEKGSTFPHFQSKRSRAFQNSPKFSGKCPRTRFSFPLTPHETLSYHCNKVYAAAAVAIHPTKQLPKSGTVISSSRRGTGLKEDEIHGQLHKCAKDLNSVIQHVKLLNHNYIKNLGVATAMNLKSKCGSLTTNPNGTFMMKDRDEIKIIEELRKIPCIENYYNNSLLRKRLKDSRKNKDPTKLAETVSEYSVLRGLLQSPLPDEGTPGMSKKYLHKQYLVKSRTSGHFLEKILKDEPKKHSFIDFVFEPRIQRVVIQYFKRKTTGQSLDSVTSFVSKKQMPKIPMKPCILKIKMTQHGRQTTRKQYISALTGSFILSGVNYTIMNNVPRISRFANEKEWRAALNKALIKSEEMTLPLSRSLYTGMTHPPSSLTDKLVMKFDRTDAEMFYKFLNDIFGNPKRSQQQKDKRASQMLSNLNKKTFKSENLKT